MIKTFFKLKILKFILIGGVSAAYAVKRYCNHKNENKNKQDENSIKRNYD